MGSFFVVPLFVSIQLYGLSEVERRCATSLAAVVAKDFLTPQISRPNLARGIDNLFRENIERNKVFKKIFQEERQSKVSLNALKGKPIFSWMHIPMTKLF